jgi:penicillin-binding protein 1A
MPFWKKRAFVFFFLTAALTAAGIGTATGLFLARTQNIQRNLDVGEYTPALPSLILDRRGKLITRFFAEEKREILALDEISPHIIQFAP